MSLEARLAQKYGQLDKNHTDEACGRSLGPEDSPPAKHTRARAQLRSASWSRSPTEVDGDDEGSGEGKQADAVAHDAITRDGSTGDGIDKAAVATPSSNDAPLAPPKTASAAESKTKS